MTEEYKQRFVQGYENLLNQGNEVRERGVVDVKMLNLLHNIDQAELDDLNIEHIYVNFQPIDRSIIEMISIVIGKKRLKSLNLQFCNLTKDLVDNLNQNLEARDNVSLFDYFYFF